MQRVIIDVPNLGNPQNVVNGSIASALITKAYKNGIFISENATNGDVIKAMFPNVIAFSNFSYDMHLQDDNGHGLGFLKADWWDAPYKKEGDGE